MKLKRMLLPLAFAAILSPVKADEGMWLLPFLKQQNSEQLKKLELKLDVDDIYNPERTSLKDAIVIFGGGCTGEIISPEGLILTNHHCGYSAIQQHSSVEHDYLSNGFWAMDKKDELPTPGLEVRFIDKIEEVTDFIQEEVSKTGDPLKAFDPAFLDKMAKEKVGEKFLAENPFTEISIKPFFGGNRFFMFTMKVYKDIRFVGAPPSSIGKFGADTDNWMWPRHTGDFSLFRVYTDAQGNPAEYSENNIPMHPKKYFNISLKGIKENDFAMIMGFPGSTNRYYTSWEVKQRRDVDNTIRINMRGIRQKEMLDEMLADPKVRIQYASKYARSSNYWKNSIGMNRGINKLKVIENKELDEARFKVWANDNNHPEYIQALNEMRDATLQMNNIKYQYYMLLEALYQGVEFSGVPARNKKLIEALEHKNDSIIKSELADLEKAYKAFANKDYNRKVDQRVSKVMLKAYMKEVGKENRPEIFTLIDKKFDGNIDRFVDEAFKTSIFGSDENFNKFMKKPTAKALKSDLMIQYAQSVIQKMIDLRKELKPINEKFALAKQTYIKGLLEMNPGKPAYPDANFTIRATYGQVLPYSPSDGIDYHYYTTLKGVMEKEDPNNWEFVVPEKLKELYKNKDFGQYAMPNGEMPVNFLSNNDITGGNSGSPVFNANGELIGTAFDGNWEAMSGDIVFEEALQRTISVDIRYILFIIDKFAGAKNIIDEMSIVK